MFKNGHVHCTVVNNLFKKEIVENKTKNLINLLLFSVCLHFLNALLHADQM